MMLVRNAVLLIAHGSPEIVDEFPNSCAGDRRPPRA